MNKPKCDAINNQATSFNKFVLSSDMQKASALDVKLKTETDNIGILEKPTDGG